jgi:hypothetical protein
MGPPHPGGRRVGYENVTGGFTAVSVSQNVNAVPGPSVKPFAPLHTDPLTG